MKTPMRWIATLFILNLMFAACKKETPPATNNDNKKEITSTEEEDDASTLSMKNGSKVVRYNCTSTVSCIHRKTHRKNHGKKATICHNGQLVSISLCALFSHLKEHSTDLLFSCDATKGITYDELQCFLDKIILNKKLKGDPDEVIQRAFNIWYYDYYRCGKWRKGTNNCTVVVTPPPTPVPTMKVCHNNALVAVSYQQAFAYFQQGDKLFSCDFGTIYYTDVEGTLLDIIYDYTLDENAPDVLYQSFVIWYNDYYLVGNWPPDGGGSGGGGSGDGGTGSDTTVVIHN